MHLSKLKKCKETLSGNPLRLIEGVEPDAMKVASPVPNGGLVETYLLATRHEPTQQPYEVKVSSTVLNGLRHEVARVAVMTSLRRT